MQDIFGCERQSSWLAEMPISEDEVCRWIHNRPKLWYDLKDVGCKIHVYTCSIRVTSLSVLYGILERVLVLFCSFIKKNTTITTPWTILQSPCNCDNDLWSPAVITRYADGLKCWILDSFLQWNTSWFTFFLFSSVLVRLSLNLQWTSLSRHFCRGVSLKYD